MNTANLILQQLGGAGKLTAMLGAHSFSGEKDRLRFKFKARAHQNIKCINIVLEPSDTYRVEFWSVRGINVTKVAEHTGVYCDSLIPLVESVTGLAVRL
jgi:hypothetical protein